MYPYNHEGEGWGEKRSENQLSREPPNMRQINQTYQHNTSYDCHGSYSQDWQYGGYSSCYSDPHVNYSSSQYGGHSTCYSDPHVNYPCSQYGGHSTCYSDPHVNYPSNQTTSPGFNSSPRNLPRNKSLKVQLKPTPDSKDYTERLLQLRSQYSASPLPAAFDTLVTELSCGLCDVTSPEPKYMKPHYSGARHSDEVRAWLEEWFHSIRKTKNHLDKPTAYEFLEEDDYCFVCLAPFSNKHMARMHYDGKHHEKILVNIMHTLAIQKFNEDLRIFKCDKCNVNAPTQEQLNAHLKSVRHARRLRSLGYTADVKLPTKPNAKQAGNEFKFECNVCGIKTYTEESLNTHLKSTKHMKNVLILTGEGTIKADGITSTSNIFSYGCDICEMKFETLATLKSHLESKNHRTKLKNKEKNRTCQTIEPKDKQPMYRCELCDVNANALCQFEMHLSGLRHKKAVAKNAGKTEVKQESTVESDSSLKRTVKSAPYDNAVIKKRKLTDPVANFLRRYEFLTRNLSAEVLTKVEVIRNAEGACGHMIVLIVPGEYLWHSLQRNSQIWAKSLSCESMIVEGEQWRVTASFGEVSGIVESSEAIMSRMAAGELLLHKLQQTYYTINMPQDLFSKVEVHEIDDDDEEEEEEEEEEEGYEEEGRGGEGQGDSGDTTIRQEKTKEDEKDYKDFANIQKQKLRVINEKEIDPEKVYLVNRDELNVDISDIERFEDMVNFHIQDYLNNFEDFRDLVFMNFYSDERSSIRDISVEYGVTGDFRNSSSGVVVFISKVKTLYKHNTWTFLMVLLKYNHKFQNFEIVEPGQSQLFEYNTVKYINN